MTLALHITLWILTAAAVLLAAWSLFHDRARGRQRCPRCWHDMAGLEGRLVCPECGKDARRASRLTRTRRRWRLAVPCVLAALLLPTWLRPAVDRRDEGWSALVPTTGLIVAYKWTPKRNHFVNDTLEGRQTELTDWQIRMIGSWVAPLSRETAKRAVLCRDVWFRGEPIPIACPYPRDLSAAYFALRIEVRDDTDAVLVENHDPFPHWQRAIITGSFERKYQNALPAAFGDAVTYSVTVRLADRWDGPGFQRGSPLAREADHRFELRLRLVDRNAPDAVAHVIRPVRDAAMDAIARKSAYFRLHGDSDGAWLHLRETDSEELSEDVTFTLDVEVLDGDEVIWSRSRTSSFLGWSEAIVNYGGYDEYSGQGQTRRLLRRILNTTEHTINAADLRVRLRSRPDLALYELEYDRYWEGVITLPFLELFENQHPDYRVVGE